MSGIFSALKHWLSPPQQAVPSPPKSESQAEKQARHRKEALTFVKQKHQEARYKQYCEEAWHRRYGKQKAAELKQLSGTEFEQYLEGLFKQLGYDVELTPASGDYGADLLLCKDGQRIAVQAKCYKGSVGISAVQEALSGMAYYGCQSAWVVTTGNYTGQAIRLAKQSQVKLIDSTEIGKLIRQLNGDVG